MGKKRSRHENLEEEARALEEAEELEAELAAVREMLKEKQAAGEEEEADQPVVKTHVYNKAGLLQALQQINEQNGERPWPETLDICQFPSEVDNIHDDLQRETAFYKCALAGVKEARARLTAAKIPYKRPQDFFCDMLKSDAHMAKVKDRLIFEQRKIAAVEERKKQQANRKFSKALKSQKAKDKTDEKKKTAEAIRQWQKTKAQRRGQGLLPDDDGLDEVLQGKSPGGGRFKPNKRRQSKDKKYGFGGPKRNLKRTDPKSLNDFSTFNPKKGKAMPAKKGGSAKKGANRPGKQARQMMRKGGKRR